jgi:hypothetical protein
MVLVKLWFLKLKLVLLAISLEFLMLEYFFLQNHGMVSKLQKKHCIQTGPHFIKKVK